LLLLLLLPLHAAQATSASMTKVFLAGSWTNPPTLTADMLVDSGCRLVTEWWKNTEEHASNVALLSRQIAEADVYVLDMRSPDFGTHHFAGSYLGAGIALAAGKRVVVVVPDEQKGYTSLLPAVTSDDELLRAVLPSE
jgi:hypothetical protein